MAYSPGTVLTRKVWQDDVWDEVRVIGRNPISHASGQNASEWEGEDGQEVVVTPTSFGANKPLPIGQLDAEYDIAEIPEEHPHAVPEPAIDLAPITEDSLSPEQAFRAQEKEAGVETSTEREATPLA